MNLLVDSIFYVIDLQKVSRRLLNATIEQRMNYEVSVNVVGIHWPDIDEDLLVENLLRNSDSSSSDLLSA